MKRFVGLGIALVAVIAAVLAGVTLTGGSSTSTAAAAAPQQQIGLKVLLITSSTDSSTGDGAAFADWENTLNSEGVPYDTVVTSSQSLPALSSASGGTDVANYQGVIVAGSGTEGLSTAQWTTLQAFEQHFSVRQLTADAVPSADYGLQTPANGGDSLLDPTTALALTTDGQTVFPYLKSVSLDPSYQTYGAESAPLASPGGTVDTLISGPSASSMVGIYTTPDGRQTMYQTFNMGPGYLQSELLRHGELAWLTRGTYFGEQRNYLETDIDDNFLSDDVWDTTTHSTDYTPADALREIPADVTQAKAWSAAHNFRIDMLFNGGGSQEYAADNGSDPLLAAFKADNSSFGWINHTWDHPNIDQGCATQHYIEAEIQENSSWATSSAGLGLTSSSGVTANPLGTVDPQAVVTGEHSGLANLIPGNPGTVDPPEFDDPTISTGSLPAGTYTYAITDDFTVGGPQSSASTTEVTLTAPSTVTLNWEAVCHAAEYHVYRSLMTGTTYGPWMDLGTVSAAAGDFTDPTGGSTTNVSGGGATEKSFPDADIAGTAATVDPLTQTNQAVESPYEQNTTLAAAFSTIGIKEFGSDASKPYPNPATSVFTTTLPPEVSQGSTFTDGGATAIPRYPTNIYYNVSTQAEEVDEYNWLYEESPNGVCNPSTTTCISTPLTFSQILNSIAGIDGAYVGMFQHMMGNDPRPDYFHQTNMMDQPQSATVLANSAGDGLYYSLMNELLAYYNQYFAANAPITQPTMAQIAQILSEQNVWSGIKGAQVTGSIDGSTVTVSNSGSPVETPLTGTNVGTAYAGTTSGWTLEPAGTMTYTATTPWPEPPTVPVIVTVPTGPGTTIGVTTAPKPQPGAPTVGSPTKTTTTPITKIVRKPAAIYYRAVQVAPKTVKITDGRVAVSLKCVASRGKTAKGKVCKGRFTLSVAGQKMHHAFEIKSTKVDRIAVKLPKVAQTATGKSKHHRIAGKLSISTKQSHAKARVARGKLMIRR